MACLFDASDCGRELVDLFSSKCETVYLLSILSGVHLKRFLLKLFIFGIWVSSIVGFVWWTLENEIQKFGPVVIDFPRASKMGVLLKETPMPKVIFAGDSRAEKHLIPSVFANQGIPTINIATSSATLWSVVRHMEVTNVHRSPAIFIISVSIFDVNDGAIHVGGYSPEQFFAFTPFERLSVFGMSYFMNAHKNLAMARATVQFDQLLSRSLASEYFLESGFNRIDEKHELKCNAVHFHSNTATGDYEWYKNVKLTGAKWRLFTEAVQKLATWPGKFILYLSTVPPYYRDCIAGSYVEQADIEFSNNIKDLVAPLKNVSFEDLSKVDAFKVLSDEYYNDRWHLNPQGAEIFTKIWLTALQTKKLL
jgi:hypothetical protein